MAGGGMMFYNGDLSDKSNKVFTKPELFNPYACIGVTHWLTGNIEGSLILLHGKVSGADSLSGEKNNVNRNLSFQSSIDELSLRFEFNAFHKLDRNRVNPFVFTGASAFHFNPKANLNNTWYELQPLGTEGQNIVGGEYPKPYSLTGFAIPIGFGITIQAGKKLRVKVEFSHRLLFTDYLDDVSTEYPDLESLLSTPNGELAVALSNRKADGKYPIANRKRGNPDSKDAYTSFGITIIYNPGTSRCPASFSSNHKKHHFSKVL